MQCSTIQFNLVNNIIPYQWKKENNEQNKFLSEKGYQLEYRVMSLMVSHAMCGRA